MNINVISYKKQAIALFTIVCGLSFAKSFGMEFENNVIFQTDINAFIKYKKNALKTAVPEVVNLESLFQKIVLATKNKPQMLWCELKNIINNVIYNIPTLYRNTSLNILHSTPNELESFHAGYPKKITQFFNHLELYLADKYKNQQVLFNFRSNKQALKNGLMKEIYTIKKQLPSYALPFSITEQNEDIEQQELDIESLKAESDLCFLTNNFDYKEPSESLEPASLDISLGDLEKLSFDVEKPIVDITDPETPGFNLDLNKNEFLFQ